MKKVILALIIVLVMPYAQISAKERSMKKLSSLVREYEQAGQIEVVTVGGFLLSLARSAAKHSEPEEGLGVLDGIRKVTIVDIEDAKDAVKKSFQSRALSILGQMEVFTEVKGDDGRTVIYGCPDGNGLKDMVLFSEGSTLICIEGTIAMSEVRKLMEN